MIARNVHWKSEKSRREPAIHQPSISHPPSAIHWPSISHPSAIHHSLIAYPSPIRHLSITYPAPITAHQALDICARSSLVGTDTTIDHEPNFRYNSLLDGYRHPSLRRRRTIALRHRFWRILHTHDLEPFIHQSRSISDASQR